MHHGVSLSCSAADPAVEKTVAIENRYVNTVFKFFVIIY